MPFDQLKGKTALVTGASRGIGEAAARTLGARRRRRRARRPQRRRVERIAQEIVEEGGRAAAIRCDVARYADVAVAVERAQAFEGRLDILVNNAGVIDPIAHLAQSDPDAWARAADVNYKGVYHGLRAALPPMLRRGAGVIVNISSGAATSPLEGWGHYCSTKAAVLMLTRCADLECRDRGIRVVGLSPGPVATDMQVQIRASGVNPVSRLDPSVHLPPAAVGKAIAWLCTDEASDLAGVDFSLKSAEGRLRAGLVG